MKPRWILPTSAMIFGLVAQPATAQAPGPRPYVVYQPQPMQAAPMQYRAPYRVAPARPRATYVRPFARSPYTDDWSTGRNLPYPKPWMIPRR